MSHMMAPDTDVHLDRLCAHIARNRFLPVPPVDKVFVGDGDYRAIGAEFLGHFVRLGRLRPADRVLEIGCGIGRMALPLTQYLAATYDGVDVVKDGIAWSKGAIASVYPNFRFHHLDVANALYNPEGKLDPTSVHLPFPDGSFDFMILTSVITHLLEAETRHYAAQIGRLLAPRGRCFLSLFLVNDEARHHLRRGASRLPFDPEAPGPDLIADAAAPHGAVAYDETFLLDLFGRHGLRPTVPAAYGHWSGRQGPANFQDLLVLTKETA